MSETRSPQSRPEYNGHLGFEAGETVCTDCGLAVLEYRIDHSPEWCSSADDDYSPAQAGAPLTRSWHDRGLSTGIGRSIHIKGRKRRQFTRMCRQHNRARISIKRERSQVYTSTGIRHVTSTLSLPDHIRDRACSLFEPIQNEDPLRGRLLEGFAAAYVYAACRAAGVPRSVEKVCDVSKITEVEYQAAYGVLNRDLGLPAVPADPTEYLPRFVTKLDPGGNTERRVREHVTETRDGGLASSGNLCGVAVTRLYTAVSDRGEDRTQAETVDVTDVVPVILRKTYVALRKRTAKL